MRVRVRLEPISNDCPVPEVLIFTGADIGSVGLAGSDSYADGTYTVSGAGADIGGATDAFRFVSTSMAGDASVTAQITSQTSTDNGAKAGVMIRDGSAANAAFAAVVRTPGNGLLFEWRSTTGGNTAWVAVPTPLGSVWVRLTRSGNALAAYYSTDGVSWTAIGAPQTVTLSSSALVGLAVSSHNTAALTTAVFNNLWVASGSAPTVAAPAAASASIVTGTTVNLSVLGADGGGESNLTYTWYLLGNPPDQVTYSANGANAAKNTTATFTKAGTYQLQATITDSGGSDLQVAGILNAHNLTLGGTLSLTSGGSVHAANISGSGSVTVGNGAQPSLLTADSILVGTLTVAAGSTVVINPLPGGPLAGNALAGLALVGSALHGGSSSGGPLAGNAAPSSVPEPSAISLLIAAALGILFLSGLKKCPLSRTCG